MMSSYPNESGIPDILLPQSTLYSRKMQADCLMHELTSGNHTRFTTDIPLLQRGLKRFIDDVSVVVLTRVREINSPGIF